MISSVNNLDGLLIFNYMVHYLCSSRGKKVVITRQSESETLTGKKIIREKEITIQYKKSFRGQKIKCF